MLTAHTAWKFTTTASAFFQRSTIHSVRLYLISSYITTNWSDLSCSDNQSFLRVKSRSHLIFWSRDLRLYHITIWKYFAVCNLYKTEANSPPTKQNNTDPQENVTDPPGILLFPSEGKRSVNSGNRQEEEVQTKQLTKLLTYSHRIQGLVHILKNIILKEFY